MNINSLEIAEKLISRKYLNALRREYKIDTKTWTILQDLQESQDQGNLSDHVTIRLNRGRTRK